MVCESTKRYYNRCRVIDGCIRGERKRKDEGMDDEWIRWTAGQQRVGAGRRDEGRERGTETGTISHNRYLLPEGGNLNTRDDRHPGMGMRLGLGLGLGLLHIVL